jgi:hypothetical protein
MPCGGPVFRSRAGKNSTCVLPDSPGGSVAGPGELTIVKDGEVNAVMTLPYIYTEETSGRMKEKHDYWNPQDIFILKWWGIIGEEVDL